MKVSLFDYYLPDSSIAQTPAEPRDSSKLMVVNRKKKVVNLDSKFKDLPKLLSTNDVLVLNKTKVFPARIIGKKDSGGKIELLLLKDLGNDTWEVISSPGVKPGQTLSFPPLQARVISRFNQTAEVQFNTNNKSVAEVLDTIGLTPLPPYIHSADPEDKIRQEYQTVYAKKTGSAAAPTAGLHFTPSLLAELQKKGIQIEYVTLHVGLGTFAPLKEEDMENHEMHQEYFELDEETAQRLNDAKCEKRRIISVGTTTTRVLETCANENGMLTPEKGETSIFIYPPYKFEFIDGLITNFHLPKSTLLALVAAFVSYPNTNVKFRDFKSSLIGVAYSEAIKNNFRFYSFGDACLIY